MSDPRHSYRYPQGRYEQAKTKAAGQGITVSDVVTGAIDEFLDGPPRYTTDEPDSACRNCDDCPRFRPQRKSPLRCKCGDIQGVHW